MEHQEKHSPPAPGRSARWSILIRLYQKWRAWRLKVETRRALLRMNDERLKDIGLTRDDIDRF
ncbi:MULTISPECIES: DUF1127 domain-containing protein [unclassified Brenneria]|uniref:DUF1127 domain-containing protein n=1 Tax=unclassified Brenneria TaxID=2634434 RepID=UPI001557F639|nr:MULTISPECIES: DUF1127 domain-containing protein [unclassified Brenneria]MBJ7224091.1 DUF1127 domain-containing protein [Brenneria sp. L3-3C-1]MEE3645337.1 DUF1127 domain-containing protein [Brenneria sp. L3_3C_1]MEE3653011.1 DUF1127 domain-containing protein [Brenneria sp. HEZEL_4_2_4]NPD02964.1 DUF1127 domain-containing protein [Brenneria sp. hezel4-2-4]